MNENSAATFAKSEATVGEVVEPPGTIHRVGMAADHGGYELKEYLAKILRESGHEVIGFGDGQPNLDDDYPDFVVPLARAVACGEVERGVAICGSGVGASVCANKVAGVRASLIHECFSAHQGVEGRRPEHNLPGRPCGRPCAGLGIGLRISRLAVQWRGASSSPSGQSGGARKHGTTGKVKGRT
jgi:hypothetical protein